MAAIAFDPLGYTRELEASGVPREQAEVHAKAMTATFLHNFDALVTRDYLDTRFTEFESRIESNIDKRFIEVDKRFVEMEYSLDQRFVEVETRMDKRFAEVESRMDKRFADVEFSMDQRFAKVETSMDQRFTGVESRTDQRFADFRLEMHGEIATVRGDLGKLSGKFNVMAWMLAVLIAGIFVPLLREIFVTLS